LWLAVRLVGESKLSPTPYETKLSQYLSILSSFFTARRCTQIKYVCSMTRNVTRIFGLGAVFRLSLCTVEKMEGDKGSDDSGVTLG